MAAFDGQAADKWYERNKKKFLTSEDDPVMKMIRLHNLKPRNVLEIGCADGYRLQWIHDEFGSDVYGNELSISVMEEGEKVNKDVCFNQGSADCIVAFQQFDLIIYGFCMYLVDTTELFRVANQCNLKLVDGGHIIIWDYEPTGKSHEFRPYLHADGVREHHMDFSKMFTWHPDYELKASMAAPEGPVHLIKKVVK